MGSNLRVPLFRQMQGIARFENQIKDLFWSRVKNGGKSEDAQEQLLRKLLKQHYSGITVALFVQ